MLYPKMSLKKSELTVSKHPKRGRKGSRGQESFRPWKRSKKTHTKELTDETPETEAEPPQPAPEEPVETRPSDRLASLRWAENTVRRFRGDPRSLLSILEVYVMYNHQRISPEAVDFFQKEIARRTVRSKRKKKQPIRPFWRTKKPEPRSRSA